MRNQLSGALRVRLDGRPFYKRRRGYHDAGRVDADVAYTPFNALREVDDFSRVIVFVIKRFQVRFQLQSMVNRHREALRAYWNKFRYSVSSVIRMSECARDVAHSRSRHHSAECPYLGDVVLAILTFRIRDHVVPAIVGDIHINVGSLRAFRV